MKLLEELKPRLVGKDLKIILPLSEEPTEELKGLGETATTKARIYVDYKGTEANTGSIAFSTGIFNLVWLGS
jgi:hypothetical protein